MKRFNSFLLLFLCCYAELSCSTTWWHKVNNYIATINTRFAKASENFFPASFSSTVPNDLWEELHSCNKHCDRRGWLSQHDLNFLKEFNNSKSATANQKDLIGQIFDKHEANVARAAREVKSVLIALVLAFILFKNRSIVGKRWEQIKDVITGAALVGVCYLFRHKLYDVAASAAAKVMEKKSK